HISCPYRPVLLHALSLRPPPLVLFFFQRRAAPRHLHSFPTRRSSDLAWVRGSSAVPKFSCSQSATSPATSASSHTRWEAPSKRCTSACGTRASRSRRKRSEKVMSRGPQANRVGTCSSRIPSATRSSVGREGHRKSTRLNSSHVKIS